jgi:large subunit ribosomal protein L10
MPREIKQLMLKELEDKFRDMPQTGCVLVNYQGTDAGAETEARRQLRSMGAELTVVKNSLFRLAMKNVGAESLAELVDGPVAVVRGEDAIAAAKAVKAVVKEFETFQVCGAFVDGEAVGPEGVATLAEMPGREELLGMILGQLLTPARQILSCLSTAPQKLVGCIEEVGKREQESAAQ